MSAVIQDDTITISSTQGLIKWLDNDESDVSHMIRLILSPDFSIMEHCGRFWTKVLDGALKKPIFWNNSVLISPVKLNFYV